MTLRNLTVPEWGLKRIKTPLDFMTHSCVCVFFLTLMGRHRDHSKELQRTVIHGNSFTYFPTNQAHYGVESSGTVMFRCYV